MKTRLLALLLLGLAAAGGLAGAQAPGPLVVVGRIDTPIHPAAANYVRRLIAEAEKSGASLIVLGLSTPGGLLSSTREITSAMLASRVPIVTYVSPSGSSSASAGFFLLEAGDVAAMAPSTNTGAAHPVAAEGKDLPKTLNEKAEQDARAFIRTLARQRGRNAEKAEAAVTSSISYTETEAKDAGLIEVIARDVPDLVAQLDGRSVKRVSGKSEKLGLAHARIEPRDMGEIEKLLGVVSHPDVAVLLMLLGIVGIYFELSTPGAVLPGIVGGIALLLAFYAFSVLPVNLAGIALIIFGVGLFIAEIKVASHGLLAVGGGIALVAGSLILFYSPRNTGGYRLDLVVILPGVLVTVGILALLAWKTLQLRRMPARTGVSGMIGETARVVEPFTGGRGRVHFQGEYWEAEGPPDLAPGDLVRIKRVDALKLVVERRT
jgi:membrane-bound serine protease (ClpP class)